jgi:hypothetical protein
MAREAFPGIRFVLSTWLYDSPDEGEWLGLDRAIRDEPWIDSILADAHEDFPRYPLDVHVPGDVPLINFPEISMWGLAPWGGYGANPLPGRFQRLWDQVKHAVRGGFPYSEGIFEDINKAVVVQFYWNPDRTADETVREYVSYEYPGADGDSVLSMIRGIETNHTAFCKGESVDVVLAERVLEIANRIDATLLPIVRKSWRWRILYLRAVMDRERYMAPPPANWFEMSGWGRELTGNVAAQTAMRELMTIFHCRETVPDTCPAHEWVRPPIRDLIAETNAEE